MTILYNAGLRKEAGVVRRAALKVFRTETSLRQVAESKRFLKYNAQVRGYEVLENPKSKNSLFLTAKDIFVPRADSKNDNWIFGYMTDNKNLVVSVKRLWLKDVVKYRKRLEYIVIHELGHRFLKHRGHHRKVIYRNPRTKRSVDLGLHCPDERCTMSQMLDIRDLDRHIRINYPARFCRRCLKN